MISKSSVKRGHVRDKLAVVPLSTKPLQAQERMASEADRRGRFVRHNEIGHGNSTHGIVPPPGKQVKTGRTQGHDKYGRTIADVLLPDGTNVNQI
jgi:hypothetical protein